GGPMPRPVTFVTGGGRGIGAAVSRRLAAGGHDVVLGYASDREAAESTARAVREAGVRCVSVRADVSDAAAVDRLFDTAADRLGPVTRPVNNAADTGPLGRPADASDGVLRRVPALDAGGCQL